MTDATKVKSNWGTHRWSGWPGAYCMNCLCDDPAEADIDNFPFPDDLDNPTAEEQAKIIAYNEEADKKITPCPANPDRVDPYTLPHPLDKKT